MRSARHLCAATLLAISTFGASAVSAEDLLKIAIPMRGNWENVAPDLGERAGIFKKHGIVFEKVYTAGAGETVISGSVDIGLGVGASSVMSAFAKGAPIRVIGASTTGTNDLYWYVRADSPIKTLKDATEKTTMGFSTTGSSSNTFALALIKQYGSKAHAIATGGMPATMTQLMSGQIDIGYAVPPVGLARLEAKQIRIIARASDIAATRDQTVRMMTANAVKLAKNPGLIARFVQGYAETIDWMYSTDPNVLEYYQDFTKTPPRLTKKVRQEFYLKPMLDPYRISGVDALMEEAIKFKFLAKPLTKEQLATLFQVPKRAK